MEILEVSGITLDGSLNEPHAHTPVNTSTPVKHRPKRSKVHLCVTCGKQYSSHNSLRSHTRIMHDKTATYQCTICNKMFMSNSHYMGHMNTHSKLKPYKCPKCKAQFAYAAALRTHKRRCGSSESTGKQVRCDHCDLEFKANQYLKDHMKSVHTQTLPYLCECGRRFKWRSSMKKHRDTTCVSK